MLLSIIVPIYNREATLRRCLNSIMNMEFQNYEVLMCDDGSTDQSAEICKEYQQKNPRFRYIYQRNKGVSSARNLGIFNSGGQINIH